MAPDIAVPECAVDEPGNAFHKDRADGFVVAGRDVVSNQTATLSFGELVCSDGGSRVSS